MGAESFLTLQIVDFAEGVDDRVAALLQAGTGITLTYNDGAGTLTIASTVSPTWGSIGGTLSSQTDLQAALNAKLGGSTGSTDNRILRADGTGGATVQASAVTIDDSGNITGPSGQRIGDVGYGNALTVGNTCNPLNLSAHNLRIGTNESYNATSAMQWQAGALTLGSAMVLGWSSGGANLSADSSIRRNATGPTLETRSAGGLRVRTADGSAAGAIDCGAITASGPVNVGTYTVATLPSASANAGALAQVTDSSVTTNGSAVSGSGSNRVVVFSNGSTWDVVVA